MAGINVHILTTDHRISAPVRRGEDTQTSEQYDDIDMYRNRAIDVVDRMKNVRLTEEELEWRRDRK
jgi:hypothetical protein